MSRAFAVALLAGVLSACGSKSTPEQEVRKVIADAETAAEARDLSGVMDLVSERYTDMRGQDKAQIRDLMRAYFVVNQSVHLLMRIDEITFPADELADARISVGMLGVQSQEDWRYAVDVYEFDVRLLSEDGEWRLQSAEWRRPGG
jgi:hypothetical protein